MTEPKSIHRHFKDLHVINDVSLGVGQGGVMAVCGLSSGGKSTLIRTVDQLGSIGSGEIWVDGISVADPKTDLNKVREEMGFVLQSFNLYPHLAVLENIILSPMKMKKQSLEQAWKKTMELLEYMGLAHKKDALPSQFSGGQQQRMAIAHGLAMEPRVMLFNGPTSALNPETADGVLKVMKDLAKNGMTMMCVTHETGFARGMAGRMILINHDRILREGPPEESFTHPRHEHTKQFLQQVMAH